MNAQDIAVLGAIAVPIAIIVLALLTIYWIVRVAAYDRKATVKTIGVAIALAISAIATLLYGFPETIAAFGAFQDHG